VRSSVENDFSESRRGFLTGVVVGVEDDEVLAVASQLATLTDGWSGGAGRSGVGSR